MEFYNRFNIIHNIMCLYIEIERTFLDLKTKILNSEDIVYGEIDGRETYVEIGDQENLFLNGIEFQGRDGGMVFDKERLINRRGIVYLSEKEVSHLINSERVSVRGARQDVLIGLYRKTLVQAGVRKTNTRSVFEKIEAIFTFGATEEFAE